MPDDAQTTSLFSALKSLAKSIVDLVRAAQGKQPSGVFEREASFAAPQAPQALPAPPEHFEAAQLLTQHTPGWHTPIPATLAGPSYAPAMTAFAIVFIALGAVTKWPLSLIGAVIFFLAIAKWIGELLHD